MRLTLWFLLVLAMRGFLAAQTAEVEDYLTVTDNGGGSQILHFGLDPTATDTLDAHLGEVELPPPPPMGVFDVRFVGWDIGVDLGQGSLWDYRAGDTTLIGTRVHELMYQVGSGTAITIIVSFGPTLACHLEDLITGTIVDTVLTNNMSFTLSNPGAISKLKATFSYALALPIAPTLMNPPNGDDQVSPIEQLLWSAAASASAYHVQVSEDSLFSQIVIDTVNADTAQGLGDQSATLLKPATSYWWRVAAVNAKGEGVFSESWKFTTVLWLGVDGEDPVPEVLELSPNYPNPFNPTTTFEFGLPHSGPVALKVYNSLGEEVETLINGYRPAGIFRVSWDASGRPSGVYFYRLTAGPRVRTKSMLLLK